MTLEERIRSRRFGSVGALLELVKPGITAFVALTAACGYLMASGFAPAPLFHLALGVVLATAGALALNQYFERVPDAKMRRTRGRPIPSGRVKPRVAALLGSALLVAGVGHLWFWIGAAPALVTAASALLYNGVYTPLKPRSAFATPAGAIPGALPVLIGWLGGGGSLDRGGLALFGILFCWQLVHVLALGWSLREDYRRAGFRLIPTGPAGKIAGLMVGSALALLALSMVPALGDRTGPLYLPGALCLGFGMVVLTLRFLRSPTDGRCRRVFLGTLFYWPALLGLMVLGPR